MAGTSSACTDSSASLGERGLSRSVPSCISEVRSVSGGGIRLRLRCVMRAVKGLSVALLVGCTPEDTGARDSGARATVSAVAPAEVVYSHTGIHGAGQELDRAARFASLDRASDGRLWAVSERTKDVGADLMSSSAAELLAWNWVADVDGASVVWAISETSALVSGGTETWMWTQDDGLALVDAFNDRYLWGVERRGQLWAAWGMGFANRDAFRDYMGSHTRFEGPDILGYICLSRDGGRTWSELYEFEAAAPEAVCLTEGLDLYALLADGRLCVFTMGESQRPRWLAKEGSDLARRFWRIQWGEWLFFEGSYGLVGGERWWEDESLVLRSNDLGASWVEERPRLGRVGVHRLEPDSWVRVHESSGEVEVWRFGRFERAVAPLGVGVDCVRRDGAGAILAFAEDGAWRLLETLDDGWQYLLD